MTIPPNASALVTDVAMRAAERNAIRRGVSEYALMEAAGGAVAHHASLLFPCGVIVIVAGAGNNGGDGLVAARLLLQKKRKIALVLLKEPKKKSAAHLALEAYRAAGGRFHEMAALPSILEEAGGVIDALFGTGLNRPLAGEALRAVRLINEAGCDVLCVDIPSGIACDSGVLLGDAVRGRACVTFFKKKMAHFLREGRLYSGEVIVADIGIEERDMDKEHVFAYRNEARLWKHAMPPMGRDEHKYRRGVAHIVAAHMTGATVLAVRACLSCRLGMVVVEDDKDHHHLYPAQVVREVSFAARSDAALFGMGALPCAQTKKTVLHLLKKDIPLVLDGGALRCFTDGAELRRDASLIITPHEGEFASLFGDEMMGLSKAEGAVKAAQLVGGVVVRKGMDTVIAHPDGFCFINDNAPSCLAQAGSGDILAGLIVGLVARGLEPHVAAAMAVHLHGRAAHYSLEAMVASLPSVVFGV